MTAPGSSKGESTPNHSGVSRIGRITNHQVIGGVIAAGIVALAGFGYRQLNGDVERPVVVPTTIQVSPTPPGQATESASPKPSSSTAENPVRSTVDNEGESATNRSYTPVQTPMSELAKASGCSSFPIEGSVVQGDASIQVLDNESRSVASAVRCPWYVFAGQAHDTFSIEFDGVKGRTIGLSGRWPTGVDSMQISTVADPPIVVHRGKNSHCWVVPESGRYRLDVADTNMTDFHVGIWDASVSWEFEGRPGLPVESNAPEMGAGDIVAPCQKHIYRFDVSKGDKLLVEDQNNGRETLSIETSEGAVLAPLNSYTKDIAATAPADGVLLLVVSIGEGSGTYKFTPTVIAAS